MGVAGNTMMDVHVLLMISRQISLSQKSQQIEVELNKYEFKHLNANQHSDDKDAGNSVKTAAFN